MTPETTANLNDTRWPAAFVGMLLARSLGLAAGVALAILLVAELLSVR